MYSMSYQNTSKQRITLISYPLDTIFLPCYTVDNINKLNFLYICRQ